MMVGEMMMVWNNGIDMTCSSFSLRKKLATRLWNTKLSLRRKLIIPQAIHFDTRVDSWYHSVCLIIFFKKKERKKEEISHIKLGPERKSHHLFISSLSKNLTSYSKKKRVVQFSKVSNQAIFKRKKDRRTGVTWKRR
jgi:hypothetical protein